MLFLKTLRPLPFPTVVEVLGILLQKDLLHPLNIVHTMALQQTGSSFQHTHLLNQHVQSQIRKYQVQQGASLP